MQNKNKGKNKKKIIWTCVAAVLLLIALGLTIFLVVKNNKKAEEDKVYYTQLITEISENKIEEIEMTTGSKSIKVHYYNTDKKDDKSVIIPDTQAFVELIQDKISSGSQAPKLIQNPKNPILNFFESIVSFLPTIILCAMVVLLFQMQGLGDKGKVYDPSVSNDKVTFKDVAGLDEEKQEVMGIVDFLKNSKKYTDMGAKVPKGVLLAGKPGTGKTLLAKAIAGEASVPFISISGSEFIEMFAGLGASRVRKLFDKAEKLSPCIIFIDEIDAIGSKRTTGGSGADTENNQTLNQLLVEMDGFSSDTSIIVMAATNRPEMLDEALLRPGRFDRTVTIGLPDINDREKILKLHSENKKLEADVDLRSIAGDTAGFSGAELANIINEAAILAADSSYKKISEQDIQDALNKITVGLEKRNRVVSDKDKKLTAYHEAGHAVVSKYLPTQDTVKEVSIIPRGVAGGYTMYKTTEDKFFISKTEMEEKLISLLGGRAAEKIALNDISTGASNDLEVAMQIARDMIIVYGMNDKIGPMSINLNQDPYEQLQLLGSDMQDAIGKEVKAKLEESYKKAQEILIMHRDKLDAVAGLLIEKEKINEEEFNSIFKA